MLEQEEGSKDVKSELLGTIEAELDVADEEEDSRFYQAQYRIAATILASAATLEWKKEVFQVNLPKTKEEEKSNKKSCMVKEGEEEKEGAHLYA